jgi:acetyl esterase/lipase
MTGMMSRAFLLPVAMLGAALAVRAQTSQTSPASNAASPSTASPSAASLPATPPRAPQSPASSAENPQVSVLRDVAYGSVGEHPLLLDIYQPTEHTSDSRPAIVLIHGGGWISFDKSTMRTMGMFLARSGFVAFSVDYRLFHGTENDGTENRWPAQLDDVQRAVRWIRANAAKYGIDPDHIGAFGHSAGAQLAALLGMEDTRDNSDAAVAKYSSRVQAVVDVSGPTDFTTNHDPDGDAFLTSFFGGDLAHAAKTWQDASPVFHVEKNVAPFLIFHGTQDANVPLAQAQELADKLKQAGATVKVEMVEDGHTFRTPEARKQLAFESLMFFEQNLLPNAAR